MSTNLRKHAGTLTLLNKAVPTVRQTLLRKPGVMKSVCECALNVLRGRVPLTKKQKAKLARYKTSLRKLATKRGSGTLKSKKKLVQKGGFLTALLAPLLSTVLPMAIRGISGAIKKRRNRR